MKGSALALILLAAAGAVTAQTPEEIRERRIKAGLMAKFSMYVEWPASAFPQATTPLKVGVLGADPFGETLDLMFKNQKDKKRDFVIRRSKDVAELKDCHIVFISKSEEKSVAGILTALKGAPILVISEIPGFCRSGGIINFKTVKVEKKDRIDTVVRLEINPAAAKDAGVSIKAELLELADIVK